MPDNVQKREITAELKESYLDYAMSVIVSRALPDVRDGLKPVQRRVLWSMWDNGITAGAKFRKSAYVTGETMGKFHPHGNLAIYDAIARLAQDFSLRYPLIDGQGNWGSVDGDAPAAERYTECRLSKIAEELLFDIEKETVNFVPNYDGTRQEPKVLPAKLPNLLLNGAVGIAVGMATSIPPHNLREVIDAILYLADHASASIDDLLTFIKGPDFPTGGVIYDAKAIAECYRTGRGSITARAVAEITERAKSDYLIEITAIPYQVNKSELLQKIAELVTLKKVEGIRDVRDESDREGLRIAIELKRDAPPQKVLNQLWKHTDLQKDFHFNMVALEGGIQPELMNLKDILAAYLEHRKAVVRRRAEFDLKKAEERAHILTGLAKALSQIDEVIKTIKKSADRDDAHKNLVAKFKFTAIQANAILEMRLQTLAALEHQKIEDELKEKEKLIADLQLLLKSPAKILKVIKDELAGLKEKYGDERRTKVVAHALGEFKEEDLIPEEETVISLSESGYIKRVAPESFRRQNRGGKGLIGSEVEEGDFVAHFMSASTHDSILFFTDRGRVFQTKVYEIPAASRTAKGKPVHNFLEIPQDERVQAFIAYDPKDKAKQYLVFATEQGAIKKTALNEFGNVRRSGIIAITLRKGDRLKWVLMTSGGDQVIITTRGGKAIRFKETQARAMGRAASGVRAIRLKKGDVVSSADVLRMHEGYKGKDPRTLLAVMANGYGKQTPISQYKVQGRGGGGVKTAEITAKTGPLVAAHLIDGEEELLALSQKGQIIRTSIASVRVSGRATQGVRIMTLAPGDKVAGIICL